MGTDIMTHPHSKDPNMYFHMLKNRLIVSCNYTFEKRLLDGGFANIYVYRKKCDKNDKIVIKKLKTQSKFTILNDADVKEQYILHEFAIGQILNHPLIVAAIDIDIMSSSLAFKYVDAPELTVYMSNENHLTTDHFRCIMRQLLDVMVYLHVIKEIAHMDLKPENILYNEITREIRVIDFGVSTVFNEDAHKSLQMRVVGTRDYWTPEQIKLLPYDPPKIDIWCIGLIMFEMFYKECIWKEPTRNYTNYVIFCEEGIQKVLDMYSSRILNLERKDDKTVIVGNILNNILVYKNQKRWDILKLQKEFENF